MVPTVPREPSHGGAAFSSGPLPSPGPRDPDIAVAGRTSAARPSPLGVSASLAAPAGKGSSPEGRRCLTVHTRPPVTRRESSASASHTRASLSLSSAGDGSLWYISGTSPPCGLGRCGSSWPVPAPSGRLASTQRAGMSLEHDLRVGALKGGLVEERREADPKDRQDRDHARAHHELQHMCGPPAGLGIDRAGMPRYPRSFSRDTLSRDVAPG